MSVKSVSAQTKAYLYLSKAFPNLGINADLASAHQPLRYTSHGPQDYCVYWVGAK
jgi:hypothetical protein